MNKDISPKPKAEFEFDRNIAIIIGINEYEGNSISNLGTPVNDAEALASLLEKKFGYDHVVRLINTEANLEGLKILLNETLPNELKPTEHDRLIFYFAGHGIPKNSDEGPKGYLVPQDAQLGKVETFLPMQELQDSLEKLECHHLLIILDCCFAGQFRWASTRKLTVVWDEIHREHYDRFIRYPAWQVITSSAYDQEALDQVKLSQDSRGIEENTKHSPFALALLEALGDESNADYTGDGVITSQELIVYLEERLAKLSKERQVPGLYPLKREYDKGQFIFVDPTFSPDNLSPAPELNPENNPYRGLSSFEEQHARFFFGREKLISELCNRLINSLNNCPLTAVLGVSGSGKSSLVKAGLVSKLRKESEKGKWYILEPMRPGLSPFAELAKVFLPITDPELLTDLNQISFLDKNQKDINIQQLAKKWSNATNEAKLLLILDYYEKLKNFCQESEKFSKLHDDINDALENVINKIQTKSEFLKEKIVEWVKSYPETKILLVVDQFEELITLAQSDSKTNQSGSDSKLTEGQKFLEFLKVILQEFSQNLRIIVTLRSDFEPRFINSPLKDYWNDARFPVRAMNSDELREAIAGPAEKQALNFQPDELIGQLVDEVGQMPGALPLLSFTLSELYIKLYERNKVGGLDRALQGEDYKALGGVAGALTRRATEEYDNLLKDFGEESGKAYQATMRRLMLRMVSLEGGAIARRRVVDSELEYADKAENERVNTIKDRLVAARLLVKGQEDGISYVEPAHDFLVRGWDKLQDWIQEEQENLGLQQRLTPAAVDWNNNKQDPEYLWIRDPRLAVLEKVIESANSWLNQLEFNFVQKSKEKRLDELEETKKQLQISEDRRKNALARQLAAQSQQVRQQQTSLLPTSVLLAIESMQRFPSLEADQALRSGLALLAYPVANVKHQGSIDALVFSPDSKYLKTASVTEAKNLDITTKEEIFSLAYKDDASGVVFSNDGNYLATVHYNLENNTEKVKIWDMDSASEIISLSHKACVDQVIFSPDGRYFVTVSDNIITLWNGLNDQSPLQLQDKNLIYKVIFSPDSQYLAIANDKTVKIVDVSSFQEILLIEHQQINDIAFSPDGQLLATGSFDKTVKLWQLSDGQIIKTVKQKAGVNSIAFSPNGKYLAMTSGTGGSFLATKDFMTKILEIETGEVINIANETVMGQIAFTPDSQYLATAGNESQVWELASGKEVRRFSSEQYDQKIYQIAFSPNGKYLAIGRENGMVQVFDFTKEGGFTFSLKATELELNSDDEFNEDINDYNQNDSNFDNSYIEDEDSFLDDGTDEDEFDNFDNIENEDVLSYEPNEDEENEFDNEDPFLYQIIFNTKILQGEYYRYIISPNNQYLGLLSTNNLISILEINTGKEIICMEHESNITRIDFSTNSRFLVILDNNFASILEIDNPLKINTIEVSGEFLSLSLDGKYLATKLQEEDSTTIEVWDVISSIQIKDFNYSNNVLIDGLEFCHDISGLKFSYDNQHLAILHKSFAVETDIFWKLTVAEVINNKAIVIPFQTKYKDIISDDSPPPDSIQFSPDGKFLYTVITETGNLFIWEVNTGTLCADLPPQGTLSDYDFSVDGKYFAISIEPEDPINVEENSENQTSSKSLYTVKIWDMLDTKIIYEKKFNSPIRAIAFSPDGKYLATASEDYTARVWEIATGQEIIRLQHEAAVSSVSFTSDGKVLVTSSTDGMIRGWLVFPEDLIADASSRLTRNLTEDEWEQYFGENTALEPYRKTCPNLD